MSSLFGGASGSGFQLVTFNTSLLAGIYNARTALATAGSSGSFSAFNSEPAVTAPWQLDTEPQTLTRRIASVRQQTQFINVDAASVEAAGDDVDARATFALFNALTDLETLAQYASEERTLDSELSRLDETFQTGLRQVRDFVSTQALDKLDLLFGDKDSQVKSAVDVGEDSVSYQGSVLQTGARDDVIAGLSGDEVFSVTLTKSGRTDTVTVDLSDISGDLTIDAVVDTINAQIESLKLVDENGDPETDDNGDPILDEEGNPVARYLTRFEVRSDDNFDWLIGVDGVETETLSLTADGDPSVYVASTFDSVVTTAPDKARVNTFTDSGAGFASTNRSDVASGNAALTELAEDVALSQGVSLEDDPVEPVVLATRTDGIAVDSEGFTYLVGTTAGDLGSQLGDGDGDVFLTKLDSQGAVVFQRLLGSQGASQGFAVSVDADDNVIIAGQTQGRVDSRDVLSGNDSFIAKYSSSGREIFRTQLDSVANDAALTVTTDAAGDIYVGGYADGAVGQGTTAVGGRDALILKLDRATGAISDARVFGTAGTDQVKGLAVDSGGALYAAVEENGRASVVKLDTDNLSSEESRVDLGALGGGSLGAIAVTGGGDRVVVAGSVGGGLSAGGAQLNSVSGGLDAFVTTLGTDLSAQKTRYIGTAAADTGNGLAVDGDDIYLTGRTNDALDGQTRQGPRDGFIAKINAGTGDVESLSQFGAFGGRSDSVGIAVSNAGESVLGKLGLRSGTIGDRQDRTLGTQSSLTDGQFFYVAIDGKAARKITVSPGDSFRSVASKINALGLNSVKAEVTGDQLQIKAINDGRIDLVAGPEGSDALRRLGIAPQTLLSSERLFNFEDDRPPEEQLGGTFALGLKDSFNLRDKTTAKYVLSQVQSAISTVQRSFRSLTFDAIGFALKEQGKFNGPVPTRLSNQLANYQGALARLTAGSQASTSFIA